ncbi:hypothetical protein L484_013485 [Morus notabilis]|uniref:Uncharacterized protein n=1 Tax=Morus notabilis TaxID=981085 RepID=W9QDW8_9ROSA|nr:hypothetical protein L484_013485 [Morus notabilis]
MAYYLNSTSFYEVMCEIILQPPWFEYWSRKIFTNWDPSTETSSYLKLSGKFKQIDALKIQINPRSGGNGH